MPPAGVEQRSAQADAQHLDETIHRLVECLQQKRYRATLGRRHDSPTGDGTQHPLGSPAVEDTLLQLAVARLLDAIDAQDCLRGRDGYRPQVGALEAVETLTIKLQCGRDAWGAEAAIKQFFDPIEHDGMGRM
jgi:RNA-directed DNA polymerase